MSDLDTPQLPTATVSISSEGDRTVLRLAGELDLATVGSLQETVAALIDQAPEHVIVDITDVTFMDSSGIALLLQIAGSLRRTVVRNPSPLIQRVLEVTGLTETLPVVP